MGCHSFPGARFRRFRSDDYFDQKKKLEPTQRQFNEETWSGTYRLTRGIWRSWYWWGTLPQTTRLPHREKVHLSLSNESNEGIQWLAWSRFPHKKVDATEQSKALSSSWIDGKNFEKIFPRKVLISFVSVFPFPISWFSWGIEPMTPIRTPAFSVLQNIPELPSLFYQFLC